MLLMLLKALIMEDLTEEKKRNFKKKRRVKQMSKIKRSAI